MSMILSVLKILFFLFLIACLVAWVHALAEWDGVCHGDCADCSYDSEDCELREDREHGQRKPPGTL